jgi:hypothetical protein
VRMVSCMVCRYSRGAGEGRAGFIPLQQVCELASALVVDGHTADPAINNLASLGASGSHRKNQERDLERFTRNLLPCEPYWVTLELEEEATYNLESVRVPVLLPFELMETLSAVNAERFASHVVGDGGPAGLLEFWSWVREEAPWGPCSPAVTDPAVAASLDRCLPCVWHFDGAEVHAHVEHCVWTFSFLLGRERFLFASVPL